MTGINYLYLLHNFQQNTVNVIDVLTEINRNLIRNYRQHRDVLTEINSNFDQKLPSMSLKFLPEITSRNSMSIIVFRQLVLNFEIDPIASKIKSQ
jgi:hypothetical protein